MRTFCKRNRGLCFGLELSLVLLVFALVGAVSEVRAEDTNSVYISTFSQHYQHNGRYNNNNWGIIYQHNNLAGGIYKNSFGRWVGLVAYDVATLAQPTEDIRVGLAIGSAIGYEQQPVIVTPALIVDVDYARFTVTPVVANMSFRLVEW